MDGLHCTQLYYTYFTIYKIYTSSISLLEAWSLAASSESFASHTLVQIYIEI